MTWRREMMTWRLTMISGAADFVTWRRERNIWRRVKDVRRQGKDKRRHVRLPAGTGKPGRRQTFLRREPCTHGRRQVTAGSALGLNDRRHVIGGERQV